MAPYQIDESDSVVLIEVAGFAGREERLLDAFEKCQAGRCSCPTSEYEKVESMEVEPAEDRIRIRLQPRPGERFDTAEIAACLDYTTAKVAERDRDA